MTAEDVLPNRLELTTQGVLEMVDAVEQRGGQRAESAADTVDRNGADRVVDLDPVEEEHRQHDQHAGQQADDERGGHAHERAGRGDRDEAGQAGWDEFGCIVHSGDLVGEVTLSSDQEGQTFYAGDALGSFNSWARLITGLLAGLAIVWLVLPYIDQVQALNRQAEKLNYEKVLEQIKNNDPGYSG